MTAPTNDRREVLAAEVVALVPSVADYLHAGITPETLRYVATHEALCRPWIFDLLTGLADTLADPAGALAKHDAEVLRAAAEMVADANEQGLGLSAAYRSIIREADRIEAQAVTRLGAFLLIAASSLVLIRAALAAGERRVTRFARSTHEPLDGEQ